MIERKKGLERLHDLRIKKSSPNYLVYFRLIPDVIQSVNLYAKGKLLDIGCGNKPYEKIIGSNPLVNQYIGCDIVQSSLNKVDIICEATQIPLNDAEVDTILCTQTLEHVFDHKGVILECKRLLKKDGMVIITVPMYWPLHEVPYDFFRFTRYGLENLLTTNGFKVVHMKENGGKWALFGLVFLQVFTVLTRPRIVKILVNSMFEFLDKRFPDFSNTSNLLVVGQKVD